jgi:hypothetical protein
MRMQMPAGLALIWTKRLRALEKDGPRRFGAGRSPYGPRFDGSITL